METETLNHILAKSYADLTAAERAEIADLCTSEEEFLHLRDVFAAVDAMAEATTKQEPLPQTKRKLDELFYQTHQKKGVLWYNTLWTALYPAEKSWYQRPALQLAAVFVLLIALYPVWNNQRAFQEQKMMARLEEPAGISAAPPAEADQSQPVLSDANAVQKAESAPDAVEFQMYDKRTVNADISYDEIAAPPISYGSVNAEMKESVSWNAMEKAFAHPDGIYADSTVYNKSTVYSLDQNLAVLDVLTATY